MSDRPGRPGNLVTRGHIARRLHLTRARTEAAVASPGFPEPLGHLDGSPIWRWSDVRAWAESAAGSAAGPSEDGLRLAGIRDRFRAAGFRLKIAPDADGEGWSAVRVAPGRRSTLGDAFHGRTALDAAEQALQWLETHR
ncbi:MAG TPA: hypothetical protein PKD59_12200 [Miltoncostaeaceae bacterium]|nr:hypothetical protein [Miltoncostaeaceae bacterium]